MALCIELHPVNPQPRLLVQAVEVLRAGGLLVYPTDTCYALGCMIASLRRVRPASIR